MQMEPMELQHAVFETDGGRIDAMWSDVRLHAGDIITPDDLDPLLERNDWMLVIRDWWFTDEPFGRAE